MKKQFPFRFSKTGAKVLWSLVFFTGIFPLIAQPVSGVKNIPTDYATLTAAITALNNNGISGNVEINIPAGYTEAAPSGGYKLGSATLNVSLSATSTLKIQKSGSGDNPILFAQTGTSTTTDGIFTLVGADYVTIDGINLIDNNGTANGRMEWGYGLLKRLTSSPFDGCQFDTIRNCKISLQRLNGSSRGIYVNNHTPASTTQLTITLPGHTNSYNAFYNDSIGNTNTGIFFQGSTSAAAPDISNYISNNVIYDFAGTIGGNGINANAESSLIIRKNYIDNYMIGAAPVSAAVIASGVSCTAGNNLIIDSNFISITKAAGSSGTHNNIIVTTAGFINISNNDLKWVTTAGTVCTGAYYGIYYNLGTAASADSLAIRNNTMNNITVNNSTGILNFIYINGAGINDDISGNEISNFTRTGGTTGAINVLYANFGSSSGNIVSKTNIHHNIISNFTLTATTSALTPIFARGNYLTKIYDNTISGLVNPGTGVLTGINVTNVAELNITRNLLYDIRNVGGSVNAITYSGTYSIGGKIENNTIYNISSAANTTVTGINITAVRGNGASGTIRTFRNRIFALINTGTGTTAAANGIVVSSNCDANIYNNLIANFDVPASTNPTAAVCGINISSSNAATLANIYYNTIYLTSKTVASSSLNSAGIYANTSSKVDIRNNIVYNSTLTGVSGRCIAYRRSSNSLTSYLTASGNNIWYAGTPSVFNLIYYDGSNADQTINAFKARLANRDQLSGSENVRFSDTTGLSPNFLKINVSFPTLIESGGQRINGFTADVLDSLRAGESGYSGVGTSPDIGAYEGSYIPLNMIYVSSLVEKVTTPTFQGLENQRILKITVNTANYFNPLSLQGFKFNTSFNTSSILDIKNARVYYTGARNSFDTTSLYGNPVVNPAGTFSVNGNLSLSSGDLSYFWLVYDINASGVINNILDADVDSITIGGINYEPTSGKVPGGRVIQTPVKIEKVELSTFRGLENQALARISLYIEDAKNPVVKSFKLNTGSTDALVNITAARMFYTGTRDVFDTLTPFGSAVVNPNGTFYVNDSLFIQPNTGTYYFWVAYNVSSIAMIDQTLTALLDSVTYGGELYSAVDTNQTGGRTVRSPLAAGDYFIGIDYVSLASAINELNTKGIAGPVTINVPTDYIEAAPSGGFVLGSDALNRFVTASSPLIIKRNGTSSNPLLFAQRGVNTSTDGIFKILGTDYVTIDGIDLVDTNIISNNEEMEWGYALLKLRNYAPFDGCQHITIMNSTVTLNNVNVNSRGIYANNHNENSTMQLAISNSNDANNFIRIYNDTIQNVNRGIDIEGYAAPSPYNLYDQYNDIGGNNDTSGNVIVNFTAYAIYLMNQSNHNTSYNIIDNFNKGMNGAIPLTATGFGIFNSYTQSGVANSASYAARYNNILLTKAGFSTAQATCIRANNTYGNVNISNNTLKWKDLGQSSGNLFGIVISSPTDGSFSMGKLSVQNNHMDSITINNTTGSVTFYSVNGSGPSDSICYNSIVAFTRNGGTAGDVNGFIGSGNNNTPAGSMRYVANNTIYNINNGTSTGHLILIGSSTANDTTVMHHNTVSNVICYGDIDAFSPSWNSKNLIVYNNRVDSLTSLSGNITGMNTNRINFNQGVDLGNNTITNLTAAVNATGLLLEGSAGYCRVYNNRISDISSLGTSGITEGMRITVGGNTDSIPVFNNLVSNIFAPFSGDENAVRGVAFRREGNGGKYKFYHNTVRLSGSSNAANFGSSALFADALFLAYMDLRNNIILNNTTPAGTGKSVALRSSSANLMNESYATTSDNNIWYAGAPSGNNLIYYNGVDMDSTLSMFKKHVTPLDYYSTTYVPVEQHSLSENVQFISTTYTSPFFLYPDSTLATLAESNGQLIADFGKDKNDHIRAGIAGYTGTGVKPDIGAYEFELTGFHHYDSAGGFRITANTRKGQEKQVVLRVSVYTTPFAGTLPLSRLKFNTRGTTSTADIKNARLYFTGNSNRFDTTKQFGNSILLPNGAFGISGNVNLSPGVNFLWLTYDIDSAAQLNHIVTADIDSIEVGGILDVANMADTTGGGRVIQNDSQIVVSYEIGKGPYWTLAQALADFNTNGIDTTIGSLLLKVPADYTETAPAGGFRLGSAVLNPLLEKEGSLTIRKNGTGANPTLYAATGSSIDADGMFIFEGADHVTIDGIDLVDLNTADTARMEWGYALLKRQNTAPFDGCQGIVIQNCHIELSRRNKNSKGIYANNHTAGNLANIDLTPDDLYLGEIANTNSFNKIYGNSITNCYTPIYFYGSNDDNAIDRGNDIGGNNSVLGNILTKFGSDTTSFTSNSQGVYMIYQGYLNVSNNTINNMANGGTWCGSNLYGIYIGNGVQNEIFNDSLINLTGNNITITTGASASNPAVASIYNANNRAKIEISNNVFKDSIAVYTSFFSSFSFIWQNAGTGGNEFFRNNDFSNNSFPLTMNVDIITSTQRLNNTLFSGNIIRNIKGGYIRCLYKSTSSSGSYDGVMYAMNNTIDSIEAATGFEGIIFATTNQQRKYIYNNTITNIKSVNGGFKGIKANVGSVHDNLISNITALSLTDQAIAIEASGISEIYNNEISNLISNNTIYCIRQNSGDGNIIYRNRIYNVLSNSKDNNHSVTGIITNTYQNNQTSKISNNIIARINGPHLMGISTSGQPSIVYHNTVILTGQTFTNTDGGGSSTAPSSACIGVGYENADIRNNIFINKTMVNGIATIFVGEDYYYNPGLNNYDGGPKRSNNNILYAGTPSPNRTIYFAPNSGSKDETLAQFQLRIGAEYNSISADVQFLDTTGLPLIFMKPDTASPSPVESAGQLLLDYASDTAIQVVRDYYDTTRAGYPGYAGTGTNPDIGAVEGNYIGTDLVPPSITFNLLQATGLTGDRVFTAMIADSSGVLSDTVAMVQPKVYYKKMYAGTWFSSFGTKISGSAKSSIWRFVIDSNDLGSMFLGDSIYYFLVAQDSSVNQNIGTIPVGGLFNPNGTSSFLAPPSRPYVYVIRPSVSGRMYTVGTGGDFDNLTGPAGAFANINSGVLSGNVTYKIISDIIEPTTVSLNKWLEDGTGGYEVKIIPDAATERVISARTYSCIIKLNQGVERFVIDGSFNGTGRYLRISNDTTIATGAISIDRSRKIELKNCIFEAGGRNDANTVFSYSVLNLNESDEVTISNNAIRGVPGLFTNRLLYFTHDNHADNVSIIDNEFYNFTVSAIVSTPNVNYDSRTSDNWLIQGNSFFRSDTLDANLFTNINMVSFNNGGKVVIRKNSFGGSGLNRAGRAFKSNNFSAIDASFVSNLVIDTNLISNINALTGFTGINLYQIDTIMITDNTIGGEALTSDTIQIGSAQAGTVNGIVVNSRISKGLIVRNSIANISILSGTTTGIFANPRSNMLIADNLIQNITTGTGGSLIGIQLRGFFSENAGINGRLVQLTRNKINNIGSSSSTTDITGINIYETAPGVTIIADRNTINNLASSNAATGIYVGIANTSENALVLFKNNQVSIFKGNAGLVKGIHTTATNDVRYYYNSVFLGGSSGLANSKSFAFYIDGSVNYPIDLKNNIFYNARRLTGTGSASYFMNITYEDSSYLALMGNKFKHNLIFVGDTAKMYFTYFGAVERGLRFFTNNFTAYNTYNTNWIEKNNTIQPQQLFTDTAAGDLSINVNNAASWYANGKGIALDGISGDYNNETGVRSVSIAGGATDIGAYEFTTSTSPLPASASGIPVPGGTTVYSFANRNLAKVTWGNSGIVPGSLDVKYFTGSDAANLIAGKPHFNAYYNIAATGGSGYTYSLQLAYDSAILGNVSNSSVAKLARYSGSNWNYLASSSASPVNGMLASGASLADVGIFTGTDVNDPLPVKLLNFTAARQEQDVALNWTVASESDAEFFVIERSFDGIGFIDIARIRASKSNSLQQYKHTDMNPALGANPLVIYYRLRIAEHDGTSRLSNSVTVRWGLKETERGIIVYPNPFVRETSISIESDEPMNVKTEITDITGHVLSSGEIRLQQGENVYPLNTAELNAGIYFVSIDLNGTRVVRKIVKQ